MHIASPVGRSATSSASAPSRSATKTVSRSRTAMVRASAPRSRLARPKRSASSSSRKGRVSALREVTCASSGGAGPALGWGGRGDRSYRVDQGRGRALRDRGREAGLYCWERHWLVGHRPVDGLLLLGRE